MVSPNMVPPSCVEDVKWIHKMLTRYPASPPYKSADEATYHRTRSVSAGRIAARVWKVFHEFQTALETRDEQKKRR